MAGEQFALPAVVGWWRGVKAWCIGENTVTEDGADGFGTCWLAMIGNLWALITTRNGTPEVMSDGEIEYADHQWTGFNPLDRSTDRGLALVTMMRDWMRDGWPGQPTLIPRAWCALTRDQIALGVYLFGAVCAWVMLPMPGDDPDWSDNALARKTPGTAAHAVLIVEHSPGRYWLITWGEAIAVSEAWLAEYGRGYFGVLLDQWTHPDGIPAAELQHVASEMGQAGT